jgi:predicted Rossmann fold nucleotide-binding protein DprA/Smf involved in DNA uptake
MEYTESVAELLRTRIGELEALLESHRRALAALEEPVRDDADALFGRNLSELRVRRQGQEGRRRRRRASTRQAAKPDRAERQPSTRNRSLEEPDGEASAEAVLDALRGGRSRPADIAKHVRAPVSKVRQRLRELEETGRIRRRG